jgi:hypothetical protein
MPDLRHAFAFAAAAVVSTLCVAAPKLAPANAALVIVTVRGRSDARYTGTPDTLSKFTIRLVASEPRRSRPLLDQSQALPFIGTDGQVASPSSCTTSPVRRDI